MPTTAPPSPAVPTLSVADIQRALTVIHSQNASIPSPGTIDGKWGSNTQASYLAWTGANSALLAGLPNGLAAPMQARDTIAWTSSAVHDTLYEFAMMYRSMVAPGAPRSAVNPLPGGPPTSLPQPQGPATLPGNVLIPATSNNTATWIILGIAVVSAGAFAYALSRNKKRRRL